MIKIFMKGNLNQRIRSLLITLFFKSNLGWTVLSFGQILSFVLSFAQIFAHIIFWSKVSYKTVRVEPYCFLVKIVFLSTFSIKTIWVELYCLLIKIFLKDNIVWIFWKNYMDWTILSFDQNLLKREYKLKRILSKLNILLKHNMGSTALSFGQNFQ